MNQTQHLAASAGFLTVSQLVKSGSDSIAHCLACHIRVLGICWLLYGLLRVVVTIWLVFFSPTATLMFGTLLNRVPNPFAIMNVFHFTYMLIILWSAVCAALSLLAGVILLAQQGSGRILAIAAGFVALPENPFGLILGVYTLIVLLPFSARQLYPAGRRELEH